jgi:hypothetical protein
VSAFPTHAQVNTLLHVPLVSIVLPFTTLVFPAVCDETAETAFDVLIEIYVNAVFFAAISRNIESKFGAFLPYCQVS